VATGWRLVNADDYSPHKPFADGVSTSPGTVSGPFWVVTPGLRWLALIAVFCPLQGPGDVSTVILQEVEFDMGDVIDTLVLKEAPSPMPRTGFKITSGTVSDFETASAVFTDIVNAPEP